MVILTPNIEIDHNYRVRDVKFDIFYCTQCFHLLILKWIPKTLQITTLSKKYNYALLKHYLRIDTEKYR